MTTNPPTSPTVDKWEREFDEKFDYRHYDDTNEKWLTILDRKDYNPASTEQMKDFIRHSVQEAKAEYQELIMAVGNKYPGETRHQTALRYIRQAEQSSGQAKVASLKQEEENVPR